LLVVTCDEDDGSAANQILTVFVGAHIQAGSYAEPITHYTVLRTLDSLEGVPATGQAASAAPIADIWHS
jgi:acid phosphatase